MILIIILHKQMTEPLSPTSAFIRENFPDYFREAKVELNDLSDFNDKLMNSYNKKMMQAQAQLEENRET